MQLLFVRVAWLFDRPVREKMSGGCLLLMPRGRGLAFFTRFMQLLQDERVIKMTAVVVVIVVIVVTVVNVGNIVAVVTIVGLWRLLRRRSMQDVFELLLCECMFDGSGR